MWKLLQTLARPPEGAAADELAHWMWRRWVLRALMTVVVLPVVVCGLWGVPWLQEAWAARYGPCATLIPRDQVEELLGVEVERVQAWTRSDGCRAVFQVLAPAGYHDTVLAVALEEDRTVGWRLGILTRGTDKPVDSWDWDRPEQVHVVQGVGDRSVVLIGSDDPGYVELEVRRATDPQIVALVQAVVAD